METSDPFITTESGPHRRESSDLNWPIMNSVAWWFQSRDHLRWFSNSLRLLIWIRAEAYYFSASFIIIYRRYLLMLYCSMNFSFFYFFFNCGLWILFIIDCRHLGYLWSKSSSTSTIKPVNHPPFTTTCHSGSIPTARYMVKLSLALMCSRMIWNTAVWLLAQIH